MTRTRELYHQPSAMEPLFPVTGSMGELREMAADLLRQSAQLGGALHSVTRASVVRLLRSMNSYYSNLIEGHNTHPLDIEKALRNELSADPAKRALQLESRAHVEVQLLIEQRLETSPPTEICDSDFLCWIHKEFYDRLPEEFRMVQTATGGTDRVEPGQLRVCEVEVGRHVPPTFTSLPKFMARFKEGYAPTSLDPLQRIIGAAASHHRLAWIHPFLDGNGRVTRLFTHAYLIQSRTEGHGLWMVSRGLARHRDAYLAALSSADAARAGDFDGRGNLSDRALGRFCQFFLSTAMDQVTFMRGLLDLDTMQERIQFFAEREHTRSRLPAHTPHLLRDIFLRGHVTRGDSARTLQMPERTARRAINVLLERGLLETNGPAEPLRLGLPVSAVGYYFPRLYPEGVEMSIGQ